MATESSPTQHGIRFCVKNTFIDICADEEQPGTLIRRHTEPLSRKGSQETAAGGWSEVLSSDCSVECWSDAGSDAQELQVEEEGESVALPVRDAQACIHGRSMPVTVKNTFISLGEDLDEESPMVRRCRTVPAKASAPLDASEGESDLGVSKDSDDSLVAEAVGTHCFASLTPTPWASEEQLRFWTPVPEPAAPLPVPEAPGKVTVSAQDKSLAISQAGSACRVQWTVDAKKLKSSDKQVVSPPLEVCLKTGSASASFKLMLYPKGGSSFKKTGGIGHVQLKCCSDLPEGSQPASMISVSCGGERTRGPFVHGFGASSVFGMPKDQADWDFSACVEPSALNFTVTVEIAPFVSAAHLDGHCALY